MRVKGKMRTLLQKTYKYILTFISGLLLGLLSFILTNWFIPQPATLTIPGARGETYQIKGIEAHRRFMRAKERRAVEAYNDGVVQYLKKNYKEAILKYQESIDNDPRNPDVYNSLGCALDSYGEIDEAIKATQKAIELNSKVAIFHSNLGNCYLKKE
jgi:tetratricopeptide (TPR) repeat protein